MDLFDIFFAGRLVQGVDPEQAKQNLAKLFKIDTAQAEKFFSGQPETIKRGVDKEQAMKYKAAMHKAGMIVQFKAHQSTEQETSPQQTSTQPPASASSSQAQEPSEGLSLAPAGSDVLKPEEKRVYEESQIDTSSISLTSPFTEPMPTESSEQPTAPDTNHISIAAAGEDLLVDKPMETPPLPLDLDQFSLAEAGADLEPLKEEKELLDPDVSHLSTAPAGADILEDKPTITAPPPPNTDHIKIDDGQ